MARPRSVFNIPPADKTSLLVDAVNNGAVAPADLPAMLAQAKANGDQPLIAAILKACSVG